VCGQEFVDAAGKNVGPPAKRTATGVHQATIFSPGEKIAGRYTIIEMLGQGGVGAVYRARDTEIDTELAIKGIAPNLLQTDEEQRAFSRAMKAARKLQHQNITRVYDEGAEGQRRFFTMKYLEGLTLRKIIRVRHERGQSFAVEELVPIFQQLAAALDYAHKTTWHGALKPENIIVQLKITDFNLVKGLPLKPFLGIAKSRSKGFPYISPELRVEAQSIDGRTDIFSLGVILAEMITGLVYEGHFSRAFTAALEQLPTKLDGLIRRALADHPDGRFARAGEMAGELEVVLGAVGKDGLPPPNRTAVAGAADKPVEKRQATPAGNKRQPPPPPAETGISIAAIAALPGVSDDSLLELGPSQVLLLESTITPQRALDDDDHVDSQEETIKPTGRKPDPARVLQESTLEDSPRTRSEVKRGDTDPRKRRRQNQTTHDSRKKARPVPAREAPLLESDDNISLPSQLTIPRPEELLVGLMGDDHPSPPPLPALDAITDDAMVLPGDNDDDLLRPHAVSDEKAATTLPRSSLAPVPSSSSSQSSQPSARSTPPELPYEDAATMSPSGLGIHEQMTSLKAHPRPDLLDSDVRAALANATATAEGTAAGSLNSLPTMTGVPPPLHDDDDSLNETLASQPVFVPKEASSPALRPPVAVRVTKKRPMIQPWQAAILSGLLVLAMLMTWRTVRERFRASPTTTATTTEPKTVTPTTTTVTPTTTITPPETATVTPPTTATITPPTAATVTPPTTATVTPPTTAIVTPPTTATVTPPTTATVTPPTTATVTPPTTATVTPPTTATVTPTTSETVAVASGNCPRGMVKIEAGEFSFGSSGGDPMRNFGEADASTVALKTYCIDYYEAPNGKDDLPTTGVSWAQAKSACDRGGKRLCSEAEWERACKGPGGSRFTYGNTYDVERCNTEDGDGKARPLASAVEFKKCRSGFNVFAMSGNAEEWVAEKIAKGGAADRADWSSRCSARNTSKAASGTRGYRCCADPR
jgi:serine/threonine protein kinase/formylglycine-generating enzyme required for sulfatase activity